MSESEPKTKTIYVCPECGWVRPENYSSRNCGRCNSTLVPKIVKVEEDCERAFEQYLAKHVIIEYTEEYRNRNWRKCRHGKDLRDCLEYYSQISTGGQFIICCKADKQPCDAKWMGDKD